MTTAPASAALAMFCDDAAALGDVDCLQRCALRIDRAEDRAGAAGDYLRAYTLDSALRYVYVRTYAISHRLAGDIAAALDCERTADEHLQETRHRERLMRRTHANTRRLAGLGYHCKRPH